MNKKIIVVITILVMVMSVTAYLNRLRIKDKVTFIENAEISIKVEGGEDNKLDFPWIQGLGEEVFHANLKRSGKEPEEQEYKGVLLKKVFDSKSISLEGKKQLVIRSIDGYTVALTVEEVLEENNVYIVYERNGSPLGTKEDGGSGPYQIIIRNDPFSQRWAKFVVEIEAQ